MATAGRRRGRRDNGLEAHDWRPVDDLDPRLSEDVLELLRAQGIAAYVQPAMDVDPVTRSATLPSRPRDRLFVDRQQSQAARDHLNRFLDATGGNNTGAGTDLDATFADIVAGFDRPVDPLRASWPAAESLPTETAAADQPTSPPEEPAEPAAHPGPVDGRHVTEQSLLDALDALDQEPTGESEPLEKFVPPPPPPLPRLSRQTVLGALAVFTGLVMVVVRPDALPFDQGATMLLGFAAMLGGATALISRLRADPDDNHPDDGARV